jgi:hypothetical protein
MKGLRPGALRDRLATRSASFAWMNMVAGRESVYLLLSIRPSSSLCALLPGNPECFLCRGQALPALMSVVYFTLMCAVLFGLSGIQLFGGSLQRQCILPTGMWFP